MIILFICHSCRVLALDDGLARTPPMGWNGWNCFRPNINQTLIRSTADAIATNGMKAAGYESVIVDSGWKAQHRGPANRLVADTAKFPSGMKALADYVHSRGLEFGIYTDAGAQDCDAGTPGSKGFEALDAATFAEWGVDYLKEDWCNTEGMSAKNAYKKMHDALVSAGRRWSESLPEVIERQNQ